MDETEGEMKARIESLESQVETLTAKVNEVVACLEDNNLSRNATVDFIYSKQEEEEAEETPEEETPEE